MDARSHVAAGLARLVAEAGVPDVMTREWRNRLLDEVGSDHRALATLLTSLVDDGHVERLQHAVGEGTSWARARMDVAMRMNATRFVQPDVAQWATDAWGAALGLMAPAPSPVGTPARPAAAGSPRSRAHVPSRTRRGAPMAPRATPPVPTSHRTRPAAPQGPVSTLGPRQALLGAPKGPPRILGFPPRTLAWVAAAYALILLAIIVANWRRGMPIGAMPATRPAPPPPGAAPRRISTVRSSEPMQSASIGGSRLVPGAYDVVVRLTAITGDPSCREVWRSMPEAQSEVRTIRLDERGTYHFDTTPDISWTPDALGYFRTGAIAAERGGVRYTFQMSGRGTASGIEASTETWSRAVLRWRREQTCRMVASLSATPLE